MKIDWIQVIIAFLIGTFIGPMLVGKLGIGKKAAGK